MTTTNNSGSFAGKVAFVTGAASGIGRAAALAFAREGASVVAGYGERNLKLFYYSQAVRIGNRVELSGQAAWNDGQGNLTDDKTKEHIRKLLQSLVE